MNQSTVKGKDFRTRHVPRPEVPMVENPYAKLKRGALKSFCLFLDNVEEKKTPQRPKEKLQMGWTRVGLGWDMNRIWLKWH